MQKIEKEYHVSKKSIHATGFILSKVFASMSLSSGPDAQLNAVDEETENMHKDSIIPMVPKYDVSLAKETMCNGNAVVRFFNSSKMGYDVPIVDSLTTYWGMFESLCKIRKRLVDAGNDPAKFCVLCPRYALTNRKKSPGGDTQAGGGGKTTKYWNQRERRYCYENFSDAVIEELMEELRIIGGTPCLESEIETVNISRSRDPVTGAYNPNTRVYSNMYSFRVSECKAPSVYNSAFYATRGRRGEDVVTEKVGFIPWGSLEECLQIVSEIPVDAPCDRIKPVLNDGIDAISIVSLPKAIMMALGATTRLRGTVVSERYL